MTSLPLWFSSLRMTSQSKLVQPRSSGWYLLLSCDVRNGVVSGQASCHRVEPVCLREKICQRGAVRAPEVARGLWLMAKDPGFSWDLDSWQQTESQGGLAAVAKAPSKSPLSSSCFEEGGSVQTSSDSPVFLTHCETCLRKTLPVKAWGPHFLGPGGQNSHTYHCSVQTLHWMFHSILVVNFLQLRLSLVLFIYLFIYLFNI